MVKPKEINNETNEFVDERIGVITPKMARPDNFVLLFISNKY